MKKLLNLLAKFDLAVGGQALIEGVMMRTPHFISLAIRKPNGTIHVKKDPFESITKKYKVLGVPVIRGIIGFIEMLVVGTKALNYSAEIFMEDGKDTSSSKKEASKGTVISLVLTIIFSLVFAILIFKFIPLWLTYKAEVYFPLLHQNYFLFNLMDGCIKILMLIGYIAAISLSKDIRRVFEYHGAEHKSIYTYEENKELTVEEASKMTRFHPRCGTSFIFVVFFISIFVYTFIPRHPLFLVTFAYRILFLPLIAGVSYEFLKWAGKHRTNSIARTASFPGLWLQRLTTREPDNAQLEVALTSLKTALELETKHHTTNKPTL